MKKLFVLLALVVVTIAAKPPSGGSGWKQLNTNLSRWTAVSLLPTAPGDVATAQISSQFANYTAFILTNMTGNIAGKTMTAVFTVQATSGDPGYVWGGYNHPTPGAYGIRAEAGLYFSTDTGFPRNGAPPLNEADNYWYTPFTRVLVDDLLGTVTISCAVQPANWSNAYGAFGSDPSHVAGFMAACQNLRVAGLALASEHFYDIGVGVTNGTAVLHVHSLTFQ